jgi:hypothetical protein
MLGCFHSHEVPTLWQPNSHSYLRDLLSVVFAGVFLKLWLPVMSDPRHYHVQHSGNGELLLVCVLCLFVLCYGVVMANYSTPRVIVNITKAHRRTVAASGSCL